MCVKVRLILPAEITYFLFDNCLRSHLISTQLERLVILRSAFWPIRKSSDVNRVFWSIIWFSEINTSFQPIRTAITIIWILLTNQQACEYGNDLDTMMTDNEV